MPGRATIIRSSFVLQLISAQRTRTTTIPLRFYQHLSIIVLIILDILLILAA